jgi:integrase
MHLRPLILFMYWCGVRKGEALQIQWAQVDLNARLVWLEPEQTKSKDDRVVKHVPPAGLVCGKELRDQPTHGTTTLELSSMTCAVVLCVICGWLA